ncbi:MAG: flavodoxin family protein [Candidatus Brocadiia bacterium]
MEILVLNGSPRKNGNTTILVAEFAKGAAEKDHHVTEVRIYDRRISGCIACDGCKKEEATLCVVKDDFQALMEQIHKADCMMLATPVYFGQISGPLKCVLDRFYCFFSKDYSVRVIKGKKLLTLTVSGAPEDAFADISDYLKTWLVDFGKMEMMGSVVAGGAGEAGSITADKKAMESARELGRKL